MKTLPEVMAYQAEVVLLEKEFSGMRIRRSAKDKYIQR